MLDRLQHLPDTWQNTLGAVGVTAKKERFCFYIPEQGSEYVHAHGKPNEFIQKLVDLVGRHDCTMSKIRDLFYGHSSQVESKKIEMANSTGCFILWMIRKIPTIIVLRMREFISFITGFCRMIMRNCKGENIWHRLFYFFV